jgi:lipoic acid synthetase
MTIDKSSTGLASSADYDPLRKQKSAEKTARIPIKIVPLEHVLKGGFE